MQNEARIGGPSWFRVGRSGTRMDVRSGSSAVGALLLSALGISVGALATTACDGPSGATEPAEGGASVAPAPDAEAEAGATDEPSCKSTFPVSQPHAAPCCAEWGVDACGAGLFCAAFDGRAQTTCYEERSRRHRETCLADNNCLSDHCDARTGTCLLRPGAPCNLEDPCGRDQNGTPHECQESRCTPSPCDPIRQTGCEPSEACDIVGATTGCREVGPMKLGESCSGALGALDRLCARRLTCYDICRRICRTSADCPGQICLRGGSSPFAFCG